MVDTTNLESYYKLDEASGTISDSHGSNDGTNNGAAYGATGKINDCLDFEAGDGDYVTMGNVFDFERTDAFSVSLWYKPESFVNDSTYLYSKFDADSPFPGYCLRRTTTTTLSAQFVNSFVVSNRIVKDFTSVTLTNGTWYHIVLTYDGSSGASGVKLYIDGSEHTTATTVTDTLSSSISTTTPFNLGGRENSNSAFDGLLDEVAIFSEELSSTDVSDLYNSGDGLAYPFASDVTVTPSAVTLSTTDKEPEIIVKILPSPESLSLNVPTPTLIRPITITPSALSLSAAAPTPTVKIVGDTVNLGTVEGPTGTIGTRAISKRWPVTEGLIAGTTKQTGVPYLEEQGW